MSTSARELEDLIDLADEKGLLLATVTGDADLSTDNGRLYARIKGAVGKSEIERKAARQRRPPARRPRTGCHSGPGVRLPRRHPPTRPAHRAARQAGIRGDAGRVVAERHCPNLQ